MRTADLRVLEDALASSSWRYASIARLWLWVGVLTGLRPTEWQGASWQESGPTLVVRNAKHTNGRAHGVERRLRLHLLTPTEQEAIHSMVDLVAVTQDFPELYQQVRKTIARAGRLCWPRRIQRPSLYSARHQWTANAKRVYTQREVAAMAGHASEETAGIHYARRIQGEEAHLPMPDAEDMRRVRVPAKRHHQKSPSTPPLAED